MSPILAYVLTEDLTGRDLDGSNPLGLSDMMSGVMSGDVMKKDKLNDLNVSRKIIEKPKNCTIF